MSKKWINNGEGIICDEFGDIAVMVSHLPADADLIAAAPEMLEALRAIAANPGDCDPETGYTSGHIAKAAIRLATGREQP